MERRALYHVPGGPNDLGVSRLADGRWFFTRDPEIPDFILLPLWLRVQTGLEGHSRLIPYVQLYRNTGDILDLRILQGGINIRWFRETEWDWGTVACPRHMRYIL